MILVTIKRSDGSIEKRHIGEEETTVRDVVVSRYLGSLSGSIDNDATIKGLLIEKISHLSEKK